MKKSIWILAVSLSLASGSRGYADYWSWLFIAQPYVGEIYSSQAVYGSMSGASDDYDDHDWLQYPQLGAHVTAYHQMGVNGWSGPTGFYIVDFRSEILSPQQLPQIWDLYVYMNPESPDFLSTITLEWRRSIQGPPLFASVTLQFLRNAVDAPPNSDVGTLWNLTVNPSGFVVLPAYRTDDGRNGYLFRMTAEVIPEPSSLVALGGGLMGALAAMRRRRMR